MVEIPSILVHGAHGLHCAGTRRRLRLALHRVSAGDEFGDNKVEVGVGRGLELALGDDKARRTMRIPNPHDTTESISLALDRIEEKLVQLALREVASDRIGELVMRELKKLDKVAYIRFASVYRNFEDVDEFSEAIREVKKPRQPRARS